MRSGGQRSLGCTAAAGLALVCLACSGQRGPTSTVDKPAADTAAPVFVLKPFTQNSRPDAIDIVFSVNEAAQAHVVVRPLPSMELTASDVETAEDKKSSDVKAFETTRVAVATLEPGQTYRFFLALRDNAGNVTETPFVGEFTTTLMHSDAALSGDVPVARQGQPWTFRPDGLPALCRMKILEGPTWLTVSADGSALTGVPIWNSEVSDESAKVVIAGDGCSGEAEFEIAVSGDPFFDYAWHMNSGVKNSFSWYGPQRKDFAGLAPAINSGLTGKGITVGIVDSGMMIAHPDLKNNVDLKSNINLEMLLPVACQVCEPEDTTPSLAPGEQGDQGTAVAGIIAAEGWNGIGGRGVAPEVKISAYNLSAPRLQNVSANDFLRIFSMERDIICHSAVMPAQVMTTLPEFDFDAYDRAQKSRTVAGRGGKGTVFVKAAGDLGAVQGNAAFDQRNTTSWGIVVGSHNSLGVVSRHSSMGANIWISAPGGESGYQSDFDKVPAPKNVLDFYPGLIAPDIFNPEFPCSVGYAKNPRFFQPDLDPDPRIHNIGIGSGFNLGWHDLNKDCDYTATVPVTPAAAAVTSGALALLLEANPDVTWRDLKHVIAKTAKQIDPDRAPEITSVGSSLYERTLPWIKNGAGYNFHNAYGFGALDTGAALAAITAPGFHPLPPQLDSTWILAASPGARIPTASISGVFSDYHHQQDVVIESVQVRVHITHATPGSVGVELISPNGTRSIVKAVKDGAKFQNLREFVFLSNAFYGERAKGLWQIRVIDAGKSVQAGTLNNWYLRITGHRPAGGIP